MQPITITVGPLAAANPTAIALSQTPAAGNLTLNGALVNSRGVAVLDTPRNIVLASTGNNSNTTFTIFGTDWAGGPISESLVGGNIGSVTSVLSYATVTRIASSAASVAGLTVGTGTTAYSQWARTDSWASPQLGLQAKVTGTVNFTLQFSMDDPNSPTNPVAPANMYWDSAGSPFVAVAVGGTANMLAAPTWGRILLNSGTGSISITLTQYSDAGY
jgi:hypothetical protein